MAGGDQFVRLRRLFPIAHRRAAAGLDGAEIRAPQTRRGAGHRDGPLRLDGASASAGGKTKMDLANSGAADAIDLLGPMDQVTVFAVDSEPTTVVPLTRIGDKKDELTAASARCSPQAAASLFTRASRPAGTS